MIRRGFWLLAGAAGGIVGYRRVSSLGRRVSQALGGRPASQGPADQAASRRKRHWARETLHFTRDVREGMHLYSVRHSGRPAPTLGAAGARPGPGYGKHGTDHDKREDH
jgi:hypothetical protein